MLLHVFIWAQFLVGVLPFLRPELVAPLVMTKVGNVAQTKTRLLRDVAGLQNLAVRKFGVQLKQSSPLEEQKTTMECTVAIEKSPQNSLVFTVFTVFSISKQKSIAGFSPTA